MFSRQRRKGNIARAAAMALTIMVGIPVTVILLAFMTFQPKANAQQFTVELSETSDDVAQTKPQRSPEEDVAESFDQDIAIIVGQQGNVLRPVTETFYEEEKVEVAVPAVDPKTGERIIKRTQQVVRRPRRQVSWTTGYSQQSDGKVKKLVDAIKSAEGDANKELIEDLRDRLEEEFESMHKEQAEQIRKAEERLAKLKSVHGQREENRDTIVQRRIDELLGEPDPMRWNLNVPTFSGTYQGLSAPAVASTMGQRGRWSALAPIASSPQPAQSPASSTIRGMVAPTRPFAAPAAPTAPKPAIGFAKPTPSPSAEPAPKDVNIKALFDAIRDTAEAESDLNSLISDLGQTRALSKKGLVGQSELKQIEAAIAKHRKVIELARMQLDIFAAQLNQQVESAKLAETKAKEGVKLLSTKVAAGLSPGEELADSEYQLKDAQNLLELAEYRLQQYRKALKTIDESDEASEKDTEEQEESVEGNVSR